MRNRAVEILVLDDDSDTLEILSHMLSTDDKHVETTTSPIQAMDLLARKSFHILLLDLKMPDMNGIEVLQRIREKDRDLAVIVLTAYPSVETAVASLKGGVSDYVEKPIDKDKLLDAVRSVIRSKGLLRDPEESLLASVGAKIRVKRKNQELTLKQVARRTGLSVSLLSQIERAESAASVSSLYKIASALGSSLEELFEGY
ncbi:MAG: response regulator [Deltaproteobacteria bacterium]|nr:response regulator [Deltaproteobacteria bacterium]